MLESTPVSTRFYLAYLFSVSFESIIRIEKYVNDASPSIVTTEGTEANNGLVKAFLQSTSEQKGKILKHMRDLDTLPADVILSVDDVVTCWENCKVVYEFIFKLHEEFRRLPTPEVKRETYLFLTDVDHNFIDYNCSVVLDQIYSVYNYTNNESQSLETLPILGQVPVFTLPKVEWDNPLFWPLLVHELGHEHAENDIEIMDMLNTNFIEKYPGFNKKELLVRWAKEFYADAVSTIILGPAYLCSFINTAIPFSRNALHDSDNGHPSNSIRIDMILEILAIIGYTEQYLQRSVFNTIIEIYSTQKLVDTWGHRSKVDAAEMKNKWMSLEQAIELGRVVRTHVLGNSSISKMAYPVDNCVRAVSMINQLYDCMPVCAYKPAKYGEAVTPTKYWGSSIDIKMLIDIPCKAVDIITTGWAYKLSSFREKLQEAVKLESSNDCFRKYGEYVTTLDSLLEKSLETAAVHEFYIEPIEKENKKNMSSVACLPNVNFECDDENEYTMSGMLGRLDLVRRLSLIDDKKQLVITPLIDPEKQIGSCSIDLRLGTEFIIKELADQVLIDPVDSYNRYTGMKSECIDKDRVIKRMIPMKDTFILHPGDFVLASTLEYLRIPSDLLGILEGRSTWARQGLGVHSTASFIQPGSESVITFELKNTGRIPIVLYVGMRVAQIAFFQLPRMEQSYQHTDKSKYKRHCRTMPSLYWKDIEFQVISEAKAKAKAEADKNT